MKHPLGKLWQNPDFLKLWSGETVSLFGSQFTVLAFPLTAILTLHATLAQIGLLGAARYAPFILITVFAGVWVDTHKRRPILMYTNLGRAILLILVPLAALLHILRIEYMYIVAFFMGLCQVFFDLAYRAYLPSLVTREHLVDANSKLQASASAAEIGGPGLSGLAIQLITAPFALLVDAASFLVSTLSLLLIRKQEPTPSLSRGRQKLWQQISEGIRITFTNSTLRAIGLEAATYNLFGTLILTLFVVYAVRELAIPTAILGLILGTGSVGALLGSLSAQTIQRRFGFGRTLISSMFLACLALLVLPFAHRTTPLVVSLLIAAFFINEVGVAISNVQVVSLRQTLTPDHLLGRVNASYLLVVYGATPIGALAGGLLGGLFGLRTALTVGVCCLPLALVWIVFSPIRTFHTIDHLSELKDTSLLPV